MKHSLAYTVINYANKIIFFCWVQLHRLTLKRKCFYFAKLGYTVLLCKLYCFYFAKLGYTI